MIPLLDKDGFFPYLQLRLQPAGAGQMENLGIEPLGSKRKFWLTLKDEPGLWLFKFARPNTGEHWAEKLGSEMARLMNLPAQRVELVAVEGKPGALVKSLVPDTYDQELDQHRRLGELIHGNEILAGQVAGYDKSKQWGQSEHSWANILEALRLALSEQDYPGVMQRFAGLLVLDALIGNTDRHHENWALLVDSSSPDQGDQIGLCPSYDHASSLGRELADERREHIIREGRIAEYVKRGHGAIFGQSRGKHADNPLELVRWASQRHPDWFRPWLEQLHRLEETQVQELLKKMPPQVFSVAAGAFCQQFILHTLNELRGIKL